MERQELRNRKVKVKRFKIISINGCKLRDDLYYWKDYTWVRVREGEEKVRIGLNDFAQSNAGDINMITTNHEGSVINQGETFAMVEAHKWLGPLKSPLSGVIVEINQTLIDNPFLINDDPYGEGWVIEIKPTNLKEELKTLYFGSAAVEWIKREIEEMRKD